MRFDYFSREESDRYSFFRIPKGLMTEEIFANLSTDAKLLYGLLLDRTSLSKQNGWVDENGHVYIYYTIRKIKEAMSCANTKACNLLGELECFGLIERRKNGQGLPDIIYVKDFFRAGKPDTCNCPGADEGGAENTESDAGYRSEKQNSRVPKSRIQEFRKSESNNTKDNNTDINNTNPILSGEDTDVNMEEDKEWNSDANMEEDKDWSNDANMEENTGTDMMTERNSYSRILSKHMEIDALKERYPCDKETLDSILEMVLDVVCSKRKIIRIAGDDKPVNVVKAHFLKLDSRHIEYVLGCLNENRSHIRNIKQYMLTMLYNAPITMHSYFQAMVSSNMAEGKNSQNH